MSVITSALFPLSAHVLPGGKLPLRIFEPRYIRMVKDAASEQRELSMCMLDPQAKRDTLMNMFPLITRSRIVDFESMPDGLLGITVEGIELRRLTRIWQEFDGLKVGESEPVAPWARAELASDCLELATQLQRLYEENDTLKHLGLDFDDRNASWICQRWLELLPMKADDKQLLIEQPDCRAALAFLKQAIKA